MNSILRLQTEKMRNLRSQDNQGQFRPEIDSSIVVISVHELQKLLTQLTRARDLLYDMRLEKPISHLYNAHYLLKKGLESQGKFNIEEIFAIIKSELGRILEVASFLFQLPYEDLPKNVNLIDLTEVDNLVVDVITSLQQVVFKDLPPYLRRPFAVYPFPRTSPSEKKKAYAPVPGFGGFVERNKERLQKVWSSLGGTQDSCAKHVIMGISPRFRWIIEDPESFCEELDWFLHGYPTPTATAQRRYRRAQK